MATTGEARAEDENVGDVNDHSRPGHLELTENPPQGDER